MSATATIVALALLAVPVLALVLLLRDRKRGTEGRGAASNVLRSGLMEMQNLLEPERKVEVWREQEQKRDLEVDAPDDGETKR